MSKGESDLEFTREFTRLATWWLGCRLRVMGGEVECDIPNGSLGFSLLGCHDFAGEMKLLCIEKGWGHPS